MEGISGAVLGQKIFEVYGPMALGWVAWIFTMFYLRAERKRYQDLVALIIQYFTKVNLLGNHHDDASPLDAFLTGRIPSPRERSTRREIDREVREDERRIEGRGREDDRGYDESRAR